VLNQNGLRVTLPFLDDLAARWETSKASIQSRLCVRPMSFHGMCCAPRPARLAEDDAKAGRMLDWQIRLGNVERIDAFLVDLSAVGHYAAPTMGRSCPPPPFFRPLRAMEHQVRIVRRNAQIGGLDQCLAGRPIKQEQVGAWARSTPVSRALSSIF
jgi:hypothetical protein